MLNETDDEPSAFWTGVPKVQVDPEGRPEQVNDTDWLNPFAGVRLILVTAAIPPFTVMAEGEATSVKSGTTTVTEIAAEVDAANDELPPYCAVRLSVPTGRDVVFSVATPLRS
jgi:hypothetical protein